MTTCAIQRVVKSALFKVHPLPARLPYLYQTAFQKFLHIKITQTGGRIHLKQFVGFCEQETPLVLDHLLFIFAHRVST